MNATLPITATISVSDLDEDYPEHCDVCHDELGRLAVRVGNVDETVVLCPSCATKRWDRVAQEMRWRADALEGDADGMRREAETLRRVADAVTSAPPTMPTRDEWWGAAGAAFVEGLEFSQADHELEAERRDQEAAAREQARRAAEDAKREHLALLREYDGFP